MTRVVSVDPSTGEIETLDVEETTRDEVRRLARVAFLAAPTYERRSLTWRADLLLAIADELEAESGSLVSIAQRETALATARLEGELRRTAFQFRFFAQVIRDGHFLHASIDHAKDSPMGPLPDLRRLSMPVGPVAVFGSSNFPFAFSVPGGDTASALAAGCPVIIKAHPAHPATSVATFGVLQRAAHVLDAPEGLLGLVFGVEAGMALVEAPEIAAVGFTGSVAAGQYLWKVANERATPIPFFGELGSANPLVVTPDAAAQRAEEIGVGAAGSMTLGVGQFCTKPGLIFVPAGPDGDALVDFLRVALEATPLMTMLSDSIAEHFRSGVHDFVEVGTAHHVVAKGLGEGANVGAQLFEVSATDFAGEAAARLREECFGPLALVVRYQSGDELETALEASEPSLTFSVFRGAGRDETAARLVDLAPRRAGRVIVDGYPTGVGVSWSMEHGGPWPATTSPSATSVGAAAIERWLRPVAYQNVPDELLPDALREINPLRIPRRVDGEPG